MATGRREVLAGPCGLDALAGIDGSLRWRAAGGARAWPGIAVGDLDHDGAPTDTHCVTAFDRNGLQRRAQPMCGSSSDDRARKTRAEVGMHVDHAIDLRGDAHCGSERRPHFAAAAAAIGDVGGERERVIQTTAAGVVGCDLPGTRHARPLCASRRGGCLRAAVACNDRLFGGACNGAGD